MGVKTIDVSEITVGMELAEPIKNMHGQMLIPEGTTLAENHIRLLKTWGIKAATVNSEEGTTQVESASNLDFETMAILKKRINWIPLNEHENDIYNLAVQSISKQTKI
ncbi:MAG: hypothetical protein FD143_1209 [Ignavibacteria bacterium]|nr:MAG: hypothetical protein FD143_1209 [Ignavibacteria bacterium]KAF0160719.1 MAG: hypothetical protein FD188_1495 [Ignavibacteria bacterium]